MFDVTESAYDRFMGRYSTRLAPAFADFAGIDARHRVLDVGAGTGALTSELVRREAQVAAVDPSPPFVAALERRLPGIEVAHGPAEQLPWDDGCFDAALAQLVVAFMSDAPAGVREMRRVVRRGGVVAVCMWDLHGMEMLAAVHRTQRALTPDAPTAESRTRYRSREELQGLLGADAQVEPLEVEADYSGFDDFWEALLDGAGPAGTWAKALDDSRRAAARDELHRQLGSPEGPFSLPARTWAARVTCD